MTEPLADETTEQLAKQPRRSAALDRAQSRCALGPGIGVSDVTQSATRWLLRNLAVPGVIDATD